MKLPILNLKPLGMNWVVDPNNSDYLPPDFISRLTRFRSSGALVESSSGVKYTKKDVLGKGSYGIVHSCVRSTDKKLVAIKTLIDASLESVIKETMIQSIIYQFTKDMKHPEVGLSGPYCPAVFEVGYDETTEKCYIVSELMRATTYKLLSTHDGYNDELETLVPTIFMQISTMLINLYNMLQFNHRDFKSDNCMYVRDEAGNINVRLIDFGFSCINYGKVQISGGEGMFKFCSLKSRDLTQFTYELYKYHKYFPDDLREVLEALLVFKDGEEICYMHKQCNDMEEWRDTYTFLNSNVANPNATPLTVLNVFKAYKNKKDWRSKLAFVPASIPKEMPAILLKCPSTKVYNPVTQRCVLATGAIGKALLLAAKSANNKRVSSAAVAIKHCPKDKPDYNPKTRRCVLPCKKGKKRNSTFKCA